MLGPNANEAIVETHVQNAVEGARKKAKKEGPVNVQIKTTYKNGEVMEEKKFAIEKADPADKKKKAKGKGGKKAKKPNLGQKRK